MSPVTLHSAVRAAKAGQHQQARDLFLQIVADDSQNVLAWLWLSDLMEDPDNRIIALENALCIQSDQPAVRARLHMLQQERSASFTFTAATTPAPLNGSSDAKSSQRPAPPATFLAAPDQPPSTQYSGPSPIETERQLYRQAKQLIKAGKPKEAAERLKDLLAINDKRAEAWFLLSELQPDPVDQINALQKVLALRPNHTEAQHRLNILKKYEADPWARARQLEELGEFELALLTYLSIVTHSKSAAERLQAQRCMEDLKLRQESDRIQKVSPTVNLLRLTIGPAFFFLLLILMQAGLNPLKLGLFPLLGLVSVLVGSLLVHVTALRPMHPHWVKTFGKPGSPQEIEMRAILRLFGWALLIAPHLLFFIEAGYRLVLLANDFRAGILPWQ